MSREELHIRIGELLDNLVINNNRLSLHDEKISQLDIEVLRKQCIDLYEQINQLAIGGKLRVEEPVVESPSVASPSPVIEKNVKPMQEEQEETAQLPPRPTMKAKKHVEEQRTIHNKLKDEAEMVSLFEKFNSKPLDRIAQGISISKRFEFQNNFFDGDAKEYKAFLKLLEGASDREDAFEIYHEYKNRLGWTHEELKDELKSLLYRKYLT